MKSNSIRLIMMILIACLMGCGGENIVLSNNALSSTDEPKTVSSVLSSSAESKPISSEKSEVAMLDTQPSHEPLTDYGFTKPSEDFLLALSQLDSDPINEQINRRNMILIGDYLLYLVRAVNGERYIEYFKVDDNDVHVLFSTTNEITSIRLIDQNKLQIEVGYYGPDIYCLDIFTGEMIFSRATEPDRRSLLPIGEERVCSLLWHNQNLYGVIEKDVFTVRDEGIKTLDYTLHDIYYQTQQGDFQLLVENAGIFSFYNDSLYFNLQEYDDNLYVLDLTTKDKKLLYPIGNYIYPLTVNEKYLIYGNKENKIIFADVKNGSVIREIPIRERSPTTRDVKLHDISMCEFHDDGIVYFEDRVDSGVISLIPYNTEEKIVYIGEFLVSDYRRVGDWIYMNGYPHYGESGWPKEGLIKISLDGKEVVTIR